MHGDDVASAGVSMTTQTATKATEILVELLKLAIDKRREAQRLKQSEEQHEVLSGGEVTYQKLKEGGEITMLPSFDKEDYGQLLKKAKEMDIPIASIQEHGKENTLSAFFNVKDTEAVNAIVQDIVREKLNAPEQSERMITIEKEQVEGFQMYCSDQDIPVNFMETADGVKCIFNSAYEKQMELAALNFKQMQGELSKVSVEVQMNKKGKPQIIVTDTEQDKKLTMNFCTKVKLERVLQERMGYSKIKAVQTANALNQNLSEQQQRHYLSGSRLLEQMSYYEKDIKFENENILTDKFSFCKIRLPNEENAKLTITDKDGNFAVLSENNADRETVERSIRQYLKVQDNETVKAVMAKAEKLGFAESPKREHFKEYEIERETASAFTVRGGNTVVRLDLSDKETARKQLMDSFGMSKAKAEKIIAKARQQNVTQNILKKAKQKVQSSVDTLKSKKFDRGSRK